MQEGTKVFDVIELCAGILNTGRAARGAGLNVVASYEWDKEVYQAAVAGLIATREADPWHVHHADITTLTTVPKARMVVATLPCQPFSQELSGGRGDGMADDRGAPLWEAAARIAADAEAEVVMIEEVDGALKPAQTAGLEIFRRYGFGFFHYHILAASDFGSFQVRRRLWATYSKRPLRWEPDWSMKTGPRPLQDFLLTEDDFEDADDPALALREALAPCYLGPNHMQMLIGKDVAAEEAARQAIEEGRKVTKSGYGLSVVPVNHTEPVGAFTKNYWKGGGGSPLLADRCLECGFQFSHYDSFLYLVDTDRGENALRFPAHAFCWDCVESLSTEGTIIPVKISSRTEEAVREAMSWLRDLHPDLFERMVVQPGWARLASPLEPFPHDSEDLISQYVPWAWVQIPPIDISDEGLLDVQTYLRLRLAAGATSVRRFHPREIARAFGLPDNFPLPTAPSAATRLLGNSLHIPTAEAVIRGIVKEMAALKPVEVQVRLDFAAIA